MGISSFIVPLILVILGVAIRFGKASFLIAGYNTSSKQKKDTYDENALCRFIGNLSFILAGILILIAVAKRFFLAYSTQIVFMGYISIVFVVIIAVIYMNTGNRFKKLS